MYRNPKDVVLSLFNLFAWTHQLHEGENTFSGFFDSFVDGTGKSFTKMLRLSSAFFFEIQNKIVKSNGILYDFRVNLMSKCIKLHLTKCTER